MHPGPILGKIRRCYLRADSEWFTAICSTCAKSWVAVLCLCKGGTPFQIVYSRKITLHLRLSDKCGRPLGLKGEVSHQAHLPGGVGPKASLRGDQKIKNSYTIVPAPLGIEANTIKYHQHSTPITTLHKSSSFTKYTFFDANSSQIELPLIISSR